MVYKSIYTILLPIRQHAFSSRNHSFVVKYIANKTFFNEQHSNSERKTQKNYGVVEYESCMDRAHGITLPLQQSNLNFNITFSWINPFGNMFFTFRSRFPDVFATYQSNFGCLVTCVNIENLNYKIPVMIGRWRFLEEFQC